VIAVVGLLAWRAAEPTGPAGRACEIALAAANRGRAVDLVGRVGDDPAGDALLMTLAHAGVGHAAVLRDPDRATHEVVPDVERVGEGDAPDVLGRPERPNTHAPALDPRLEVADVALGLRYLTSFGVLVVTDDVPAEVVAAALEAGEFSGAHLVLLVPPGRTVPAGVPRDATVLAAPRDADDGAFGALVGAYAAGLDAGTDPATAFREATGGAGWEAAGPA
jgi:hypothetical protein